MDFGFLGEISRTMTCQEQLLISFLPFFGGDKCGCGEALVLMRVFKPRWRIGMTNQVSLVPEVAWTTTMPGHLDRLVLVVRHVSFQRRMNRKLAKASFKLVGFA